MQLISCEITPILTWSVNCVIVSTAIANQGARFSINDTKLYAPVVTLSTQDNAELLQQLKSGFKRTIHSNKYQSKPELLERKQYLNHLIDPSFQRVNRLFVLSFEDDAQRISNKRYFLSIIKIKYYNVKIDRKNFLDQPIKNNLITHENRKIATGQEDDYTTGCLLDYFYFKENYKLTAIDSSKQQALVADPRAIEQINFITNLDCNGNTIMFFILEEANILDFSNYFGLFTSAVNVLYNNLIWLNITLI